jgi:diguanylate cyclase (GGDEF)-like protein/PAS domain S-box-containing protein
MTNWLNSFRIRLTLLFGGLSLLIGTVMAIYVDEAASARITQDSGESLRWVARSIAHSLAENLRERDREITLLAQSPSLVKEQLTTAELRQRLEAIKRSYRHLAWIGFADTHGIVKAAAGGLLEGENVSQRPWFINGRQGAFVGDVHEAVLLAKKLANPHPEQPLRFVDFASPVYDRDGKLQGVLASHALWSWVDETVEGALRSDAGRSGVEAMVVGAKGEILYPYQAVGTSSLPANLPGDDAFAVLEWTPGNRYLTSTVNVHADIPTELKWRIVIRQPIDKALAPAAELHRTLIILGLIATVVFMVLAYHLASSISRPIEKMAETAAAIQQGHENLKFPSPGNTRELRRLGQAIEGMAQTLMDRRRAIEQTNASLEQTVAERTASLSSLYNEAPVGYHTLGPDGTVLQINDTELAWLGYTRDEVVGVRRIGELLPPGCEATFRERQALMKAGKTLTPVDTHLVRRDGSLLPVRISSNAVLDAAGNLIGSRSAVMDVAEQRRLELELRSQEALSQAIIHATANGLLLYREDGQCILANEAAAEIVGATVEKLLQQNFHHISSWRTGGFYELAVKALEGQRSQQQLVSTESTFGKQMHMYITMVPLEHEASRMLLFVLKDVSELVRANQELEQLARHDALTGLYNRLAANERLREEFLRMKRSGEVYSVIIMDIDHFKRVNDTYGHETGDQVLKRVAQLISEAVRATDFVARFGGEEFLAVLPGTDLEGAQILAEKLRSAVADTPVPVVGQVTLSLGLTLAQSSDANEDTALRIADEALYRAKHQGRNQVVVEYPGRDELTS